MKHDFPILEFDDAREAIIEPSRALNPLDIAERCVLCFFQEVITRVCGDGSATAATYLVSEVGQNPVYQLNVSGQPITVIHPGVGAPMAAAFLEESIALGCRKFIACGGAGVLRPDIAVGHVVVPTSAVRDEGTSYHYLPPGREVNPHPAAVAALQTVLDRHDVPYLAGKTWTNDALYRETKAKVERRTNEGCLTVEMEAAAFFAVAQFRGVPFAQLLYGGDDLTSEEWDQRDWIHGQASTREKLFWLAAEAALEL